MKKITLLSVTSLIATSGLFFGQIQAASALTWEWSYSGSGVDASGTLTTNDTPDDLGYYLITGITGTRNNETITGLQPTGTSIPGNEPFEVDNLISLNPQQLTKDGFGYFTSGGNFVNPFFASFLEPPGYFEVFSAPPFVPGFENFGPEDSELTVSFSATPITVPEPRSTVSLLLIATIVTGSAILHQKLSTEA